jgi:predicted DNA binding protein
MSSPYGNSNEIESENAAEEEIVVVRDMTDIQKLVADNFRLADITKYEFVSLDVAYMFYCWFELCNNPCELKVRIERCSI